MGAEAGGVDAGFSDLETPSVATGSAEMSACPVLAACCAVLAEGVGVPDLGAPPDTATSVINAVPAAKTTRLARARCDEAGF